MAVVDQHRRPVGPGGEREQRRRRVWSRDRAPVRERGGPESRAAPIARPLGRLVGDEVVEREAAVVDEDAPPLASAVGTGALIVIALRMFELLREGWTVPIRTASTKR